MKWQTPVIAGIVLLIFWLARKWKPSACAGLTVALALLSLVVTVAEIPLFQSSLQAQSDAQTAGLALREKLPARRRGGLLGPVCREGLPFYAYPAICATNRPYFGDMDLTQVPFEFPGNQQAAGRFAFAGRKRAGEFAGGRPPRLGRRLQRRRWNNFCKTIAATPLTLVTQRRPVGIVCESLNAFRLGLAKSGAFFLLAQSAFAQKFRE